MANSMLPQKDNAAYSLFMQFVFILFLAMLGSLFAGLLVQSIGIVMGIDYIETIQNLKEDAPINEKNFVRIALCISHIFTFILPSFIFLWAIYKKEWFEKIKLNHTPQWSIALAASLFIIAAFPVTQFIFSINRQIPLPSWAIEQEEYINTTINYLLHVNSSSELFFNIFTIALLPSIGEELLFRGILQQNFEKALKHPHLAIWITALIFSFIHFQFQGFLPRMFLGAVLGYLFFWTRNLWIPIIAHFVTNAGQILMQYLNQQGVLGIDLNEIENVPISTVLIGLIGMGILGYFLNKKFTLPS